MNTLTVGIARSPEEQRQCFALRYSAHVKDGKRSHYLDHRAREVRDDLDEVATIHTVSDGDRIVATMRSVWGGNAMPERYRDWFDLDRFGELDPREIAFTSRLIIDPGYRQSTALPMLLTACYRSGRSKGVTVDFMHASPELIGMYERIGYRCFRDGVIDSDVGCHVPMLLTADAHDWLARIRSPFSLFAKGFKADESRHDWFVARFPAYAVGSSPNLLGAEAFGDRLLAHGLAALRNELDVDADRLRRSAFFVACAGDTVARSRDNFGAMLVQLDGCSELRSADGGVIRHRAGDTIDAFVRGERGSDIELVATERSSFLCLCAKRAEASRDAQRAA